MSNDLIVADLENGKAIEGVSFSCKEYGTTSNKFGHIDLDRLKQCDSIKINHISFREIKIARTDAINDTIFLEKKGYILPEIKLKNNKTIRIFIAPNNLIGTVNVIARDTSDEVMTFLKPIEGFIVFNSKKAIVIGPKDSVAIFILKNAEAHIKAKTTNNV